MIKSKAIELLRTFNKAELKDFEKFLNSPFHNIYDTVIKIFTILKKYYPDFEDEKLSYSYLFKRLYKNKKYNEALVRNVLSDLLKAGEDFLAHRALKHSGFEKLKLINGELINKKLYNHFNKNLKISLALVENYGKNDVDYFYYKYSYLFQNLLVAETTGHEYDDISEHFIETERSLAEYNAVLLGSFYMPYTSFDTVAIEKLKPALYDTMQNILSGLSGNTPGVITVYFLFHKLYSERKDEYYFKLKDNIKKYEHLIEPEALRNFYILLHNYSLDRMNYGESSFFDEYNEILNIFIERGYLRKQNQYISQPSFRNVIVVKVKLKDYKGALDFTENHYKELPPESQKDNYYYSIAYINFYLKNYEESLKNLGRIKYDEYLLKLQSENLMLQIYYELGYEEESLYKIDSLIHYMNTNKRIPEKYSLLYRAFALSLKKLLIYKENYKRNELLLLKKEIESLSMTSKGWLLEKINDLLSK